MPVSQRLEGHGPTGARPIRVVVAGPAGSGKTTVGVMLAEALDATFVDGDSVHPPRNVERMAAGIALTDSDRAPWLAALTDRMATSQRIVVACSALRRTYRDVLRTPGDVVFVFLTVEREVAASRVRARRGHYMGEAMVASQFDALEAPTVDEADVASIRADSDAHAVVTEAVAAIEVLRAAMRSGQIGPTAAGAVGSDGTA